LHLKLGLKFSNNSRRVLGSLVVILGINSSS